MYYGDLHIDLQETGLTPYQREKAESRNITSKGRLGVLFVFY